MHLVYDVHAVFADLRRDPHLLHQSLDVVDTVVGCRIQLMDAVGTALSERNAGFAFAARLHVRSGIGTVYCLGENSRRTRLADAARTAEQVGMGQLPADYRILESPCYIVLADQRFEIVRPVFSC